MTGAESGERWFAFHADESFETADGRFAVVRVEEGATDYEVVTCCDTLADAEDEAYVRNLAAGVPGDVAFSVRTAFVTARNEEGK